MKIQIATLAAGTVLAAVVLSMAGPASAQSRDSAYCTQLSHSYTKYVADPNAARNPVQPPADVATAQSKCSSDPGSAIPVLEKALTDQKITLPAR